MGPPAAGYAPHSRRKDAPSRPAELRHVNVVEALDIRHSDLVSDGPLSEIPGGSSVGRRVVVTGMAGAGKSTFSRALSAKTGLPIIVLDLHFWKPGWEEPS